MFNESIARFCDKTKGEIAQNPKMMASRIKKELNTYTDWILEIFEKLNFTALRNFVPSKSNKNKSNNNHYLILKDMKKIIYVLLFSFASALAISGCTEEQVTPSNESGENGGGSGSTDKGY